MSEEPAEESAEAEAQWPRDVMLRPTVENAKRLLGREDDEDSEGSEAFLFEWGQLWQVAENVESWEALEIPEGFEIANDDERQEYEDSQQND